LANPRGACLADAACVAIAYSAARHDHGEAFHVGQLIDGAYIVRSVLGTGGMGQVYAADDLDLQRTVAIKTNRADGARLRLEAQALAQVHHRNVVTAYRLGMHRGVSFLVMERLYGRSLLEHICAREIAGQPTELDEAIELLAGIAAGLTALHDAAIAHLDLKPGNVMVCAERRVVLVDLGVMVPEVSAGRCAPCGTPQYMAPELIEGTLSPGHARLADVYAFGALAFELLTGQGAFADLDPERVLHRHLTEPPRDVRALRADVPSRLAVLVRTCLSKDPFERPRGAEELAWELAAIRPRARH
jgi:serine/threonine-protein kinase